MRAAVAAKPSPLDTRSSEILALLQKLQLKRNWRTPADALRDVAKLIACGGLGKVARKVRPKPDRAPASRDKQAKVKGRLPHGSEYHAMWDGLDWIVTLTVPGGRILDGKGNGLFRLLSELDDLFRS